MGIPHLRQLPLAVLISTLVVGTSALAANGGNGGGGKPPKDDPPPPSECTDEFPSFAFSRESGGRTSSTTSIYLSSADGCRTDLLVEQASVAQHLHLNPTESAVFWVGPQHSVYRAGFTVDSDGTVTVGASTQILPTQTELDELNPGQEYWYLLPEIWSDPNSSTAYISVLRDKFDPNPADPEQPEQLDWVIYEVDSTAVQDQRVLLANILVDGNLSAFSPYACPEDVVFHRQVPGCHHLGIDPVWWNPEGTHLYLMGYQGEVEGKSTAAYRAMMRMNTTNRDVDNNLLPLSDWFTDELEIIYLGTFALISEFDEPGGAAVRPKASETEDELIGMGYIDRSGQFTVGAKAVLNADQCADEYEIYRDGKTYGPVDGILWMSCFDSTFYLEHLAKSITNAEWQSPDAILETATDGNGRKSNPNIYRRYVSGGMAGTSELLVEDAAIPSSGN